MDPAAGWSRRAAHFFAVYLLIGVASSARAGNIFDDGWAPAAKPTTKPAEAPQVPDRVKQKPVDVVPQPPPIATVPDPAPAVVETIKPVPSAAEQAKVRALFKEVYAKQLSDHAPAARRALAKELLDAAGKSADAPVDRFVLLMGARQSAIEAVDLGLAAKAVDAVAGAYDVDELKLKVEAAMKAGGKPDLNAIAGDNCREGLELIDQLVAAEDFAAVSRVSAVVQAAATADPMYAIVVPRRVKEVEAIHVGHDKAIKFLEKLKTTPDDPAANYVAGSYLCFVKGDWGTGLPMLAKGTDAAAKGLAELELNNSVTNETLQQIGERWWALGEKQGEMQRRRIREHAAGMYRRALSGATGLRKAAMEKRIADAGEPGTYPIDLSKVADPLRDGVHGRWSRQDDGALTADDSESRLELPFQPPDEYMFRVEFSRPGAQAVYQSVSKAGTGVFFVMGGNRNANTGLERVQGKYLIESPAKIKLPLQSGHRYVGIVEVRNGRVRAYLDGQLIVDWKTDFHDVAYVDVNGGWLPRDPVRPAVGAYNTAMTVYRAEVLELSGEGKVLR